MELVSYISSFISVILGIAAIIIAKRESEKSTQYYEKTRDILKEIESRSLLIDRSVQIQVKYMYDFLNKALDKIGQPHIEPISNEEIEAILNDTVMLEVPNQSGGDTVIIDKIKNLKRMP
ncbi:MAG: hypothetical protein J6D29_02995 [Solobacterium sp.]|nr:hypothetical protein [Solobacterium sp.]